MQVFDASAIVYAWDNYPLVQFPGMWRWMADKLVDHTITMPHVALSEVGHVAPECARWLEDNSLNTLPISDAILQDAVRIKNLLGIIGDQYGGGVDENDLMIIATARAAQARLISNEAVQPGRPKLMANYKIPAVCALPEVRVNCITFVEFVKQSQVVFG
ncbi:DUF4411 family protein [Janthinobacterium sp. ZB1P44]|uniref:DUF4411 family protein n=1 Tax=Janthinobacterium sp. ZB1P44 TaxID=3424192 RepID=UPI003F255D93